MMVCVVEDNIIVNTIEIKDDANPADFNAIDLGIYAAIGDEVIDGVCQAAIDREAEGKIETEMLE